jgi:hypothetical protein
MENAVTAISFDPSHLDENFGIHRKWYYGKI